MGILDLFKRKKRKDPEDDFVVTITDVFVKVEYPKWEAAQVSWEDIREIKLINTYAGPIMPDIWLVLIGENGKCIVPHGAKGFDEIYDIIAKYKGFNNENVIKSMACTDNAEFLLWVKTEAPNGGT
jgi:hypothetical protein